MIHPRLIQVIEAWELRGNGTEGNPYRRIHTFYTTEGQWLGEGNDPTAETSSPLSVASPKGGENG